MSPAAARGHIGYIVEGPVPAHLVQPGGRRGRRCEELQLAGC